MTSTTTRTCAHPDCDAKIPDGAGAACPGNCKDWFDNALAACGAGLPDAFEEWDEVDQGGRYPERVVEHYDPNESAPVQDWEVGISPDPDAIVDPYKNGGE